MNDETANTGEPIAEKDEARHAMKMAKKKTAVTRSWPPRRTKKA